LLPPLLLRSQPRGRGPIRLLCDVGAGHVFGTFDVIADFNAAQGDKINVGQMDATSPAARTGPSSARTVVPADERAAMAALAKSWRREG
jgi:hypothetical protein